MKKRDKKRKKRRSLIKSIQRLVTIVSLIIFGASTIMTLLFQNVAFEILLERAARNAAIGADQIIQEVDGFEEYAKEVMRIYSSVPEKTRLAEDEEYFAYFSDLAFSDCCIEATAKLEWLSERFTFENVYFAMFDKETETVVYLLDADAKTDETFYRVGEWDEIDFETTEGFFLDSIYEQGGADWIRKNKNKHTFDLLTSGFPVVDEEGEIYAFAMADLPVPIATIFAVIFTILYLLILMVVIIIVVILARFLMRKRIVIPVRKIGEAAQDYVLHRKEGKTDEVSFHQLDIKTGDELEDLSHVLCDMETDIAAYEEDLMKATAEKERMQTELNVAARIQENKLPSVFPAFPDRKEFDIYASMNPAKEVGGDFYDYFLIDEDHLGLVIADVSGKGIPAALFMMSSMIIINSIAMEGYSPAEVLAKANERICKNNEEDMFVTAWFGILDLKTGVITAANAGHEYPAVQHAGRGFELLKDKHGFVLGGMEGVRYKEYTITLEPGSALFLYTDGVAEATNISDELFGTDRMIHVLNQNPEGAPNEILQTVQKGIDEFVLEAPQFDDLTMMCIRYYG